MAEENYTSQSEIEEVSPPSNDAMNDQSFINQDVSVPEVNMSPTINVTPPDKFDPDISSQFLTEGSKYGYILLLKECGHILRYKTFLFYLLNFHL